MSENVFYVDFQQKECTNITKDVFFEKNNLTQYFSSGQ